jgi:hypothetical protein
MRSQLLAWRRRRIRARVKMFNEQGSVLAESLVSGLGVLWSADAEGKESRGSANEPAKEITLNHPGRSST